MPAVELARVSKHFGPMRALSDVDLRVWPGELVVLLGSNGAGKTTAMSLMLGMRAPTSGYVRVAGKDPCDHRSRRTIGGMIQGTGLPAMLTVTELLRLYASFYPNPFPVRAALDLVDLRHRASRRVGALSTGERQRLLLAIALIGNPTHVFLDEPTAFMDICARNRFWELARDWTRQGCCMVVSTHYPSEVEVAADRIAIMRRGTIVTVGTPAQLKQCCGAVSLEQAVVQLAQCSARAVI